MGKFIFWIVVFFLVLLALRMLSMHKAKREAREAEEDRAARDRKTGRDSTPSNDTMIRCASCGVFIPKQSSVLGKLGASCGNPSCERLKG